MPGHLENAAHEAAEPPTSGGAAAPRWRRWAAPAILVASLVPRVPNLGAPPLERHEFRQTQTAITVQAWLDTGFDLLGYETPVFGPPWRVPFEFPTFQASAYALARTGLPLDLACRITALLWFYLSAVLLFVLTRRFCGRATAAATLVAYVFSPFGILWSRSCLIDFASVAFALAYLLAVASWAARRRPALALAAVAVGTLASLTKITTLAVVAPGLALLGLGAIRRAWPAGWPARFRTLAPLLVMAAAPLAAGSAWTRWADSVKEASPATQWLTSGRLTHWTIGSVAQRLSFDDWGEIFVRMNWIVPGLFWVTVAFALAGLGHAPDRRVRAVALAGVFLPILVFFNLYAVHDYYLIAVTPALALLAGTGLAQILSLRIPWRALVLATLAAVGLATAIKPIRYARLAYRDTRRDAVVPLARIVEELTPREGWVVVQGDDWNPRIPYLAHRRAFMARPPAEPSLVAHRPEVATLVCFTCPADFLALWPRREWVAREAGADVYRVIGDGPTNRAAPLEADRGRRPR